MSHKVFQTAPGVKIPFPERIREEFALCERSIVLNLSFEKLRPMLEAFWEQLAEPLFFVLEIPLNLEEEKKIRKTESDPCHRKVCYLDGQTKEQIKDIMQTYGDLLLQDGLSQFAIASHVSKEEIFVQKYKLIHIFAQNPQKYIDFLKGFGLKQTDDLFTVWQTFTTETPGEAQSMNVNGMIVYDLYEELVKMGLYDAKIVEE